MTSTFLTKKDCVGCVPSSSGASEAPPSAQTSLTHKESRVGVELMRSLVWISGERPPVLGISKGRDGLGKEGAEASAQCGGVCSGIRILRVLVRGTTPLSPRAERALGL